jgi:predicted permease
VTIQSLSLVLALAAGLLLQRTIPSVKVLLSSMWTTNFWLLVPLLVFFAFSTVAFTEEIALALAAALAANWLSLGIAFSYAALVTPHRDERGALALGAAFSNTSFMGYTMAEAFFGHAGLALMVVYDRLSWLAPSAAISTSVARMYGRRQPARAARRRLAAVLINPPLWAAAAAIALRLLGVDLGDRLGRVGEAASMIVGPFGFLLFGLALPLDRGRHDTPELLRAGGSIAIRFAVAPLMLLLMGRALGASIPGVFYLGAAMPSQFILVVLAQVYDLRPHLARLLVVGSTILFLAAAAVAVPVLR